MHRTHAGCSLFAVILCLGAAVTQPDGSFEIPGVPVGEVELQLWHEKTGSLAGVATTLGKADDKGRLKVEVKAAGTDLGGITIDADAFRR